MIRRNLPLGTDPHEWLLISQVEHARLSRTLAEHWGNGDVSPLICQPDESNSKRLQIRREVLEAILHHDDGWSQWEMTPTLDAEIGRPLDFMEMPQLTAIEIWENSIRVALQKGSLAGWIVANHFLALLNNSHHAISTESEQWRDKIAQERDAWLADWLTADKRLYTESLATESLRQLQTFDWLSLWFCCTCPVFPSDESTDPQPFELHVSDSNVRTITFHPSKSPSGYGVHVEPWPFDERSFFLCASCNAVPAKRYASSEELLAAYEPRELAWHVFPK